MRHERKSWAAAVALAGALFTLGACADQGPTNPLLPDRPLLAVGDATNNTPVLELLKVCKVWVNAPVADIDVTLSGDRTGTFTVPAASGTAPNTCVWVATQGASAPATITVTEDDPGANFTTTWTVNSTNDAADASGSGLAATATIGGTGIPGAVITFTNTFVPPVVGCTYTQGYWKTHSIYGPAGPADDGWDNVGGPDAAFFSSGLSWIELWNVAPGKAGDYGLTKGYVQLAHQYMAAKLNILNGATPTSAVSAAITGAEAYFSGSGPFDSTWAGILAAFNEGFTGPGHCSDEVIS